MTGIFITARLGSTRLLEKHLRESLGKPFIKWLTERFYNEFKNEIDNNEVEIIITTSENAVNKKFESIFDESYINVFYGSDENIPLRHYQCAQARGIDYILSIDGDDILCSPKTARAIITMLKDKSSMVNSSGLPLGMNITGYRTEFLIKSLENFKSSKLETGWGRIFDKNRIESIAIPKHEITDRLRMTLDYEDDVTFFDKVISSFGNEILTVSDEDLINTVIKQEWYQINEHLNDAYWLNFNLQKKLED